MFLVLEIINPMYLLVACCCFMIVVGCACYGCYDIVSEKSLDAVAAGGVVACDMSDCEIPEIHEQHLEDKADGFWGKKAWGTDSDTCPGGIFDLPYESTSIPDFPDDYGGVNYGRGIGSSSGCNHSTIDLDFRPGIEIVEGGTQEGPLKNAEDTTIDIPNETIAESDHQDIRDVLDSSSSIINPAENKTDKNSEEKEQVADKLNASKTDLEKVSESTPAAAEAEEDTKLQLVSSEPDTATAAASVLEVVVEAENNYAEKLDDVNVKEEKESCVRKPEEEEIPLIQKTICETQEIESTSVLKESNETTTNE